MMLRYLRFTSRTAKERSEDKPIEVPAGEGYMWKFYQENGSKHWHQVQMSKTDLLRPHPEPSEHRGYSTAIVFLCLSLSHSPTSAEFQNSMQQMYNMYIWNYFERNSQIWSHPNSQGLQAMASDGNITQIQIEISGNKS